MVQIYEERLQQLHQYMEGKGIEVVMITDPTNVYYFSGFLSDPHERFMALIVDRRHDREILFIPTLDKEIAEETSSIRTLVTISDTENPFEKLQGELGAKVSTLGLEKKATSLFLYENLIEQFSKMSVTNIESFINSLRGKKTPEDIRHVKQAIEVTEKVFENVLKKVTIGMTELELTAELEYQMRILGSDGPSFSTIALSGKRSALPHGQPGNRKISYGDFLLIDMGVLLDGYCSDMTRTFLIGEGTEEQEKIYNIVLEANQTAIAAIQMGKPIGTVDCAARDVIENHGYGDYFNNRVGHGFGLEVHEEPSVHEKNTDAIEKGLLFTVEPGIYLPELGGVRIEDNIYIGEQGEVNVLTTFPRECQKLC